jgi:hypothetical protein
MQNAEHCLEKYKNKLGTDGLLLDIINLQDLFFLQNKSNGYDYKNIEVFGCPHTMLINLIHLRLKIN